MSKSEILDRLVTAGHITFSEAKILDEVEVKTVEKVIEKTIIKEVPADPNKYKRLPYEKPVPYWLKEST